jgi:carbon-monoxide dehydrogenase medium subunit
MKPAEFAYIRASSLQHALELLDRYNEDARVLAGGQSLLPMLAYRVSSPAILIDIGRLSELQFVQETDTSIRIGALTTHAEIEASPIVSRHLPLLTRAVSSIGYSAIRNRGTIGGSLALADPAAQLPACMIGLNATIVALGPTGERRIDADRFFTGTYETVLSSSELLTSIELPISNTASRYHFEQFSRRNGDFAIAGLAAIRLLHPSLSAPLRLVYFGCGDRATRARNAEALLARGPKNASREQLCSSLGLDLHPFTDLNGTAEMRLHLAAVLAKRAVSALFDEGKS